MPDEWLCRYTGQNSRRDTSATWVIADTNDVVAYANVMTGIDRSAAPDALAKGAPDPVPALLLGRLAVDRRTPSSLDRCLALETAGLVPIACVGFEVGG